MLNGAQLGRIEWFLRLQTTPGGSDSIAEALARRPDTKWVRLASGGTEIICVVEAHDPEQRDALFLRGLPGSRRVVQISAHSILHDFSPGPWRAHLGTLSEAQLAALSLGADPPGPPLSSAPGDPPALEQDYPSPVPRSDPRTSRCWLSWPETGGPAMLPSPRPFTGTNRRCGAGWTSSAGPAC